MIRLAAALGLSLLLTPLIRAAAVRIDWLRRADSDDPSKPYVPPLGGLAIVPATFAALHLFSIDLPTGFTVGGALFALVGVADDVRPFAPGRKLLCLVVASILVVWLGLRTHLTPWPAADAALTVLWLVWMANAFNVLDTMDGLAGGIGVIACVGFVLVGVRIGLPTVSVVSVAFAAALLGFLFYNTYPARIYMGDTGSLFSGFAFGSLAILASDRLSGSGLAAPLLLLAMPMFEAAFLIVVRWAKGRSPLRASRDHPAQRLVALGCTEQGAVYRMYGAGAASAALGVATLHVPPDWVGPIVGICALGMAGTGLELSRVDMEGDGADGRPFSIFSKNWLVHVLTQTAVREAAPLARGRLLDLGCGRRPYARVFGHVDRYVGLERDPARYADLPPDLCGDLTALPVRDEQFDTVLCSQVLEHVPEPGYALGEMGRVMRPGAVLILTAPHIWGVHEEPHDYFRFTPHGLRYVAERAGLEVERIEALAGYWVTAGARFCYYLERFERGPLKPVVRLLYCLVQGTALAMDRLHRVEGDAWNHILVARKPEAGSRPRPARGQSTGDG